MSNDHDGDMPDVGEIAPIPVRCPACRKILTPPTDWIKVTIFQPRTTSCPNCNEKLVIERSAGKQFSASRALEDDSDDPNEASSGSDPKAKRRSTGGNKSRDNHTASGQQMAVGETDVPREERGAAGVLASDLSPPATDLNGVVRIVEQSERGLSELKDSVGAINVYLHGLVKNHLAPTSNFMGTANATLDEISVELGKVAGELSKSLEAKSKTMDKAVEKIQSNALADLTRVYNLLVRDLKSVQQGVGARLQANDHKLDQANEALAALAGLSDQISSRFKRSVKAQRATMQEANTWWRNELTTINKMLDDRVQETRDRLVKTVDAIGEAQATGIQQFQDQFAKLQELVATLQSSLDANSERVADFDKRQMSDEVLDRLAKRTIEAVTRPESLDRLLSEYFATYRKLGADERHGKLVYDMPKAFDAVEANMNNWEIFCDADQDKRLASIRKLEGLADAQLGDAESARICQAVWAVLKGVHQEIGEWLHDHSVERFPNRDDPYDRRYHADQQVPRKTKDDTKDGRIAHVMESGYRLKDTEQMLRLAQVVLWKKTPDGESGSTNELTS